MSAPTTPEADLPAGIDLQKDGESPGGSSLIPGTVTGASDAPARRLQKFTAELIASSTGDFPFLRRRHLDRAGSVQV